MAMAIIISLKTLYNYINQNNYYEGNLFKCIILVSGSWSSFPLVVIEPINLLLGVTP